MPKWVKFQVTEEQFAELDGIATEQYRTVPGMLRFFLFRDGTIRSILRTGKVVSGTTVEQASTTTEQNNTVTEQPVPVFGNRILP